MSSGSFQDLEIVTDPEEPVIEPDTGTENENTQDFDSVEDGSLQDSGKKRPHVSDSDASPVKPASKQQVTEPKPGSASDLVLNRYCKFSDEEEESELSANRPANKYDEQHEERSKPVSTPPKFQCQDIREKQARGIPLDPPTRKVWPRKNKTTPKKAQKVQNNSKSHWVNNSYNRGGKGQSGGRKRSTSRRRRPIIPTFQPDRTQAGHDDDSDSDSEGKKKGKHNRRKGWK